MLDVQTPEPSALDLLDVQVWHTVYWAEVERRIGAVFARKEARTRALAYVSGLFSPVERKNSWQLAEISGEANPYGFQHLLGRAVWDPDALRDQLRTYVTDYLYDPTAIGVLDETGFVKKGRQSAGVARQYSGTAGRIENCQIGVFLTFASLHGHTLLDRELYLPAEWTTNQLRCQQAGIPAPHAFATKPALAQQMLERTFAAGMRLAAVTGDSVYGDDRPLRLWLEQRGQSYVLAVSGKEHVWLGQQQHSVKSVVATLPTTGWERISAGAGSKGPRIYDWLRLELADPLTVGWQRWLVVRRSLADPSDVTASIAYAPAYTTLTEQVRVAGMRWTIEESIQTAKGEVGLDQYELRSWRGWYRHITLAMWAQAFLVVLRKETGAEEAVKKGLWSVAQTDSLAAFKAHRSLQSA